MNNIRNVIALIVTEKTVHMMENGMDSVYWRAFSGLNEEYKNGRPEYEMEVVQVILP